jgi:hypothetical protein
MDLRSNNVTGQDVAAQVFTFAGNTAARIRNKAKAKKAQGIADAGNYWTLTAFQKSLIPIPQYIIDQVSGQGITQDAVLNLPAQAASASNPSIINQLKTLSGGGTLAKAVIGDNTQVIGNPPAASPKELEGAEGVKKYLPYIAGAAVLGVVIYLIAKRK